MPYYCTVPRCTSMAGKAKNVSFHQFPRDEELAKLWNKILKRGKPYTKYSKVCSLHFTPGDYTITSVGKNKGQWRTLRKDALPSQNLPSESPTPYQRKQWGSWTHSAPANVLDPTIQQQVAQAIYMQTMLAMQAAGAAEIPGLSHANGHLQRPATDAPLPHTSTATDTDLQKTHTNDRSSSYKCTECTKCFKDPDVYILHKRTHIKNEKENFNVNVTLQANPILANLLKTNTENSNIFDNSAMSVESLLMTALAANMEEYMRNFTSMIKNDDRGSLGHDRDRGSLGRDRASGQRTTYDPDRHDQSTRTSLQNRENTSQRNSHSLDNFRGDLGLPNNDRGFKNSDTSSAANTDTSNSDVIRDRIIELYRNNDGCSDRNIRYYENDSEHSDTGCQNGDAVGNDDGSDDRGSNDDGKGYSGDVVFINDDSQGIDVPICDSDLNESIESNKLVIDEGTV